MNKYFVTMIEMFVFCLRTSLPTEKLFNFHYNVLVEKWIIILKVCLKTFEYTGTFVKVFFVFVYNAYPVTVTSARTA